jgi:hypothetical protein
MSGEQNEIAVGDKSTVSIGGAIFNLKSIYNLVLDVPVQRDRNTSATNYSFGGANHKIGITLMATTPDLATIVPWADRDANGDLTQLAIIVTLVPVGGGANVTLSFNVKVPHIEIGHGTPEGKIQVSISPVITSETITVA